MNIIDDLLSVLQDGEVLDVRIGLHWTAVVMNTNGDKRCGLASTLSNIHEHHGTSDIPEAGSLEQKSGLELASMALSQHGTQASVGVAAINALLPPHPDHWDDGNAEAIISVVGAGKQVVIVGDFPFTSRIRHKFSNLHVFDRNPHEGVSPEELMPEIIPSADVVVITGMTIINHTFEWILDLCSHQATKIVLGPSTPLSPVLHDFGINFLCGSVVMDVDSVVKTASQGATFRQLRRAGIRLVTMANEVI